MNEPESQDLPESDERFPSGPWIGYYRQGGIQSRQRLFLRFANGKIDGEGRDPVDQFVVRGVYSTETGSAKLTKSYITYQVHYNGAADGDGIGGGWTIEGYRGLIEDRGEFRIWPDELAIEEGMHLRAEEPVKV